MATTKIKINKKRKPCITRGLVKSIKTRDKVYQELQQQPDNTELKKRL